MSMSPHSGGCYFVTQWHGVLITETGKSLLVFRAITRRVYTFSLTLRDGCFHQVRIFNCMRTNSWSATAIMRHSSAQSVTGRWDEMLDALVVATSTTSSTANHNKKHLRDEKFSIYVGVSDIIFVQFIFCTTSTHISTSFVAKTFKLSFEFTILSSMLSVSR